MGATSTDIGGQIEHELPSPHPGFGSNSRVWLLRHAEVQEEFQGRAYGNLDVPLSASGLADTRRVAKEFGQMTLDAVISSPLIRAKEMAIQIAERSSTNLVVEEGLTEIFRGNWQGRVADELPRDEVAAFYADPWNFDGHGGETDAQVLARSWPVLARALAQKTEAQIVLVAHYNVIRVIVAHALGIPASSSFSFRVDPGRASLLLDVRAERGESRTEVPQTNGWVLRHSNVSSPREIIGLRKGER